MPKKQSKENQKEQGERFEREVRKLIDAGELNATEANERFEQLVARSATRKVD